MDDKFRLDRNDFLMAIAVVLFGGLAISFSSYNALGSFADDGVSYMIMAKAMSVFGSPSEVILDAAKYEKYPPLFPFVLSITQGAFNYKIAHFVVALSFTLSLIVIYLFAKKNSERGYLALLATLLFAASPSPWLNMLGILSENQFVLFSICSLFYLQRFWRPEDVKSNIILGALIAATLMTRSIGIALLCAYCLYFFLSPLDKKQWKSYLPMAIPVLCLVLWYLFRDVQGPDLYLQEFKRLATNLIGMGERSPWQALQPQIVALYESWFTNLIIYWQEEWQLKFLIVALFGVAALGGLISRLREKRCDAFYVLIYLGILAFWPFPEQFIRFLYPVVPLLLLYAINFTARQVYRLQFPRKAILLNMTIVLIAACILPAAVFFPNRALYQDRHGLPMHTIQQFYVPQIDKAIRVAYNHLQLAQDMQQLNKTVPENSTIMWFTPNYIKLLAERHAVEIPYRKTRVDFEKAISETSADYVYLAKLHPRNTFETFNGLSIVDRFRPFTTIVWTKQNIYNQEPVSILLKIDRSKLNARLTDS